MIGYLKGQLQAIYDDNIILDVHGVGYRLYLSQLTLQQLPRVGEKLEFHIATMVREDAIHLFGFINYFELKIYNLLIMVSGIGPRQAMHLLSKCPPTELVRAIVNSDGGYLESLKGIGHKTAEKIILELKTPMTKLMKHELPIMPQGPQSMRGDLVAALLQLGYRRPEIENAIFKMDLKQFTQLEVAIKASLRLLSGTDAAANTNIGEA